MTNGIVSSTICYKRDDFTFEIVIIPVLDGDIPHPFPLCVYISQLIRFTRVYSKLVTSTIHVETVFFL